MKPAICTQCGANIEVDETKDAGICKYCGTAFVTEKVINKYNISNTVNIQSGGNTINITGNDKTKEYLTLARRARDNEDVEKAEKFYSLVLEGKPDDWEANFYSTYFGVLQTKIGEIPNKAAQMRNSLGIVIELLKINEADEEALKYISEMYIRLSSLSTSLFSSFRSYFLRFRAQATICYSYNMAVLSIASIMYNFGDLLIKHYGSNDDVIKIAVDSWKKGLYFREEFSSDSPVYCNNGEGDTKESVQTEIDKYAAKIKEYDATYEPPKAGGCYVATCVYGSYDCPEVWTLRRFRDYDLAERWYGRVFIHMYYTVSPTIVKWFGNTEWFKKMWRGTLDKIVIKLQRKGYESTPYKDRKFK